MPLAPSDQSRLFFSAWESIERQAAERVLALERRADPSGAKRKAGDGKPTAADDLKELNSLSLILKRAVDVRRVRPLIDAPAEATPDNAQQQDDAREFDPDRLHRLAEILEEEARNEEEDSEDAV